MWCAKVRNALKIVGLGTWFWRRVSDWGFWGGSRAFRTTPQVPKVWPSWFAGAPNLASAPSGPGFGTFAG